MTRENRMQNGMQNVGQQQRETGQPVRVVYTPPGNINHETIIKEAFQAYLIENKTFEKWMERLDGFWTMYHERIESVMLAAEDGFAAAADRIVEASIPSPQQEVPPPVVEEAPPVEEEVPPQVDEEVPPSIHEPDADPAIKMRVTKAKNRADPRYPKQGLGWSDADENKLKVCYGMRCLSRLDLEREFGRNWGSLVGKAHELKVKRYE